MGGDQVRGSKMDSRESRLLDRFSRIWSAWGVGRAPSPELKPVLLALDSWLAEGRSRPEVVLRACQVLLTDPEQGGPRRAAVNDVVAAVRDVWEQAGFEDRDVLMLQAGLLAVWPEDAGAGAFGLASLLCAGWEGTPARGPQQQHLVSWWERTRALDVGGVGAPPKIEVSTPPQSPPTGLDFRLVDSDLGFLRVHKQTGWDFNSYAPQLTSTLRWLMDSYQRLVPAKERKNIIAANGSLDTLVANHGSGWRFNHLHPHLMPVLNALMSAADHIDPNIGSRHQGALTHLRNNGGNAWHFNSFGPQLVELLDALLQVLDALVGNTATLRIWLNNDLRPHLQAQSTAIQQLADTRNTQVPETELLWWGQARYCHLLRKPYRRITDPAEKLWLAAREVATRARHLDAEPAAAYLVQTLQDMGLDVDEVRTVADWSEAARGAISASPAAVSEPLRSLATTDAQALPITWLRLGLDGDVGSRTGISPDHRLDLGDWAGWLLRELLLDLRMAKAP